MDGLKYSKSWGILLITVMGLLVFAPLLEYFVKWDSLDQYLPFRYFLSYASNSSGPSLWLPYQSLGYPVYGDMQSGFWYPVTWLHILFGGYGFQSFNIELLLHLILAGWGMFLLGKRMRLDDMPSYVMGLSYMTCGHLVGTTHVFTFVISATWMPFILYSLIDLRRVPSALNLLKAAFFIHLFLSGGYPAFSIIFVYFLIFFFLHWLWKSHWKGKAWTIGLSLAGLLLLLGSGYIAAQIEVFPWMSRSETLPYDAFFYTNSFSWKHWWSFLFPIVVSTDAEYFGSDLSMINGYVGVFTLLSALYAALFVKHPWKWSLVAVVLFALAASAGPDTPLRYWLYRFVPGFDLFRHPALLRFYVILGLILLGGIGLQTAFDLRGSRFKRTVLFSAIGLTLLTGYATWINGPVPYGDIWTFFMNNGERSDFGRWALIGFMGIPISLLVWGFWWVVRSPDLMVKPWLMGALMFFISAEVVLTTGFSVPTTVINNIRIADQREAITQLPQTRTEQDAMLPICDINMNNQGVGIQGVWRNLGIWSRRTAVDGYNPFQLKTYDQLRSDSLLMACGLICAKDGQVSDLTIGKDEISAQVNLDNASIVTLIQNPYPGWEVFVDGLTQDLAADSSVPSTEIRKGLHDVTFRFVNRKIALLFWLTMGAFLLLSLIMMRMEIKRTHLS
jgi:hypothetical protein